MGFEAHGHGLDATKDDPAAAFNDVLGIVKYGGSIGVPGIYVGSDPGGIDEDTKQGRLSIDFGKAWIKSIRVPTGMAPVMKYNYQLMQGILWGRVDLSTIMNVEVISLDKAPQAYQAFDAGDPKKFVIDPHHSIAS